MVQALDPDTMETFSCQDLEGEDEATCKSSGKKAKFMYRLQLLVKDQASQLNKNFYRILLYSYDAQYCPDFFKEPVEPCNLYSAKNADKLESLKQQLNNLQRFNVWCDAVVERQNNFFVLRDTKVKSFISE